MKIEHRFSFGYWVAPSVMELDSSHTNGFLKESEKSKQLFISNGLSITYSFNNFYFVLVPLGLDIATSKTDDNGIHDKKDGGVLVLE